LAKLKRKGKSLDEFLGEIDFTNVDKLNSSALEFEDEMDLLLRGHEDDSKSSTTKYVVKKSTEKAPPTPTNYDKDTDAGVTKRRKTGKPVLQSADPMVDTQVVAGDKKEE